MTTQVIFKIDKQLKDRAMKKAEREGLPFASVLKFATRAYADGELNIGMIPKEKVFNMKTRRLLRRELRGIKLGKNISPRFTNAKDAIAYLKNL